MQNWEKRISGRIEEFRQCEARVSEEEARRGGSVWRSSRGPEGQRQAGREAKLFSFPQHKPQAAAHHRGN